jgi:hypothetical protein
MPIHVLVPVRAETPQTVLFQFMFHCRCKFTDYANDLKKQTNMLGHWNKQINKQTNKQTNKQINKQTNKQTNKHPWHHTKHHLPVDTAMRHQHKELPIHLFQRKRIGVLTNHRSHFFWQGIDIM